MANVDPDFQTEFSRENARFLDVVRASANMPLLAEFAERWLTDARPWAREQLFRYLNAPWDRPGHEPLIKRLFKGAEARKDTELLAVFAVALDRLVRRELRRRYRWDWVSRTSFEEWKLVAPRNSLQKPRKTRRARDPWTGRDVEYATRQPKRGRLFTYHTRYYLRRRAWRYFRQMAFQQPSEYPFAIAQALVIYTDDDLADGINVIDSWTLAHACFRESPLLEFTASLVGVREGQSLAELQAAPSFPEIWRTTAACEVLRFVLTAARSRAVRVWAIELLRRDHREHLQDLQPDEVQELLAHPDSEVQEFAAECLESMRGLEQLPLATWLQFLQTKSLTGLETVCQVMRKHVTADRLSLADCVQLCSQEPAPVARMGFEYLQQKAINSAADRALLADLADSRCDALTGEFASWALPQLGASEVYDRDLVLRFFDALNRPARDAAWKWLTEDTPQNQTAAFADAALWARLLETPFDDVRLQLVEILERRSLPADTRAMAPQPGTEDLTPVWCSVLLGVHRGGRQKLKAVRQLMSGLDRQPNQFDTLLPVLSVALRSIRQPEMREALSAVVTLCERRPELQADIARELPELAFSS